LFADFSIVIIIIDADRKRNTLHNEGFKFHICRWTLLIL
jgi:hypothetical protein